MCKIVVINRGEKELGTPQEFYNHFNFHSSKYDYYDDVQMDACLCQVDVEKALTEKGIPFKKDWGDIYVGMLEQVIGDDD